MAVVTGSTSGIGLAIAERLAADGFAIVTHGRDLDRAADVAQRLPKEAADAIGLGADFAIPHAREAFLEEAWSWRGGVDAWINNAGVDVLTGAAADWTFAAKLDALWKVDVQATIHLAREAGRRMAEGAAESETRSSRRLPCIVNIGWDQAQWGMDGDSGEMFAATKGAVMAFSRSLAKSLAPRVRVNCVAPGWIQTRWGHQASEAWRNRAVNESLLRRWGQPRDIADLVGFLLSPQAEFINGQVLEVNGGAR